MFPIAPPPYALSLARVEGGCYPPGKQRHPPISVFATRALLVIP